MINSFLSPLLKINLFIKYFGWTKIPLLGFLNPRVVELTDQVCSVEIPLSYRSKNHLGAMYFGSMSAGADCAAGLAAMLAIQESKQKVSLVFKDFKGEFLKRAEADVLFRSRDVAAVKSLVQRAIETGERVEMPVTVEATCPSIASRDPVAKFVLTLSLKKK
jgi:acyl-coenzyme A thioesterase PaaI-like protein